MKHRIGMVMGDPCGIGPEIVARLLSNEQVVEKALVVVIGDRKIFTTGEQVADCETSILVVNDLEEIPANYDKPVLLDKPQTTLDPSVTGLVSAETGKWQLECLASALNLCNQQLLDGFCFAPLNKEAMHLGGLKYEDEQGFFVEKLGITEPVGMMNTLGSLWTSRVTSHVAFKDISGLITQASVLEAILIAESTLHTAGIAKPRIAVAGLNPHAGEGGAFGDEEKNAIRPAVLKACSRGVNAEGPFPADTLFLKGRDGVYDAIVTMYHDQGQIAMKLMGFDHGVTVHAGLPFPVTTSAHGSAHDIAGSGVAQPNALIAAFNIACSMAEKIAP
jgi:4-hydroxythreonine-4-phosphate dehydrogenase